MEFLKFYLISTAISSVVLIVSGLSMDSEIRRDYTEIKIKRGMFEYIRIYATTLLIPIFNIVFALYAIFGYEHAKNRVIENGVKQGSLIKK